VTVVLVAQVRPEGVAKFQEYERRVLGLLSDHGGRPERRLRSADGLTEVHLVGFPSSEAFAGYRDDPRRKSHSHRLRASGASTQVLKLVDVA
jgi:hypothetical protein